MSFIELDGDLVDIYVDFGLFRVNLYKADKLQLVQVYESDVNKSAIRIVRDTRVFPPRKKITINVNELRELGFDVEIVE